MDERKERRTDGRYLGRMEDEENGTRMVLRDFVYKN